MAQLLVINGVLFGITVFLLIAERFLVASAECEISINKDTIFEVKPGKSVLSYLAEKKIFIPSGCGGKGTCGFCKIKMLSGAGAVLPTEEVFLSRAERQSGMRLACQVKVRQDIDMVIPEHLLGAQEFEAVVADRRDLTADTKYILFELKEPSEIRFRPGQFIQINVPGTDEFRAYSIASPPSSRHIVELIVRQVPNGLCSTFIHQIMDIGDSLTFTGPFGDFYLREDSHREIVAIGGGCGMAPIRSILMHLEEKGMPRKFTYFFGARQKSDLFYTDELRKIEAEFQNFKYIPGLSEPRASDNWQGESGLITEVVEKYVVTGENVEAYLCGPPPMIDAAVKILKRKGVKEIYIYYDKF